jgi:hypothetical protein
MRYRIAQIGLILLGIIFALGTLAPLTTRPQSRAEAVGSIVGKLLVLFISIGCFRGAWIAGRNARKAKISN